MMGMRDFMGVKGNFRLASTRVEGCNDEAIAERCKHNGMS